MHYEKKPAEGRVTLWTTLCLETLIPGIDLNTAADHLRSFMAAIFPDGLARQDKAPCSPAKIVQEWFEEHEKGPDLVSRFPRSQSNRVSDGCARKTRRLHLVVYRI